MTRFYITVLGRRYELATPDSLTFDEGLEIVRLSGGMDPSEVSVRFGQMHPAAVLALTVVSIARLDPRVTEEDIRRLKITDVVNTLEVEEEEQESLPPTLPPSGGETTSDANGNSAPSENGAEESSPTSETTHAPTGTQAG